MNRKIPMLFVALSIALAPGAQADVQQVSDPDDVVGTFDLASASHAHGNVESRLVHSLKTYETWTNEEFHGARIRFWLPDGDRTYDRVLDVTVNRDDSLAAGMTSLDRPDTPFRGYANVYRTDETSFEIVMPVRLLARNLRSYRWKAYLFYDNCPEGADDGSCSGYDSHEGRVRHVIRRA